MSTINWVETIPSDGSAVGIGARDIRANKYAIAEGLRESLNLGNKIDPIKQGAPRPYIDIESNSSNIDKGPVTTSSFTRGKLYFASDTSRLLLWTSVVSNIAAVAYFKENTFVVGSPRFIEHNTDPGRSVWIETSGFKKFSTPDAGSGSISFGNVVFDEAPQVYTWSSDTNYMPAVISVTRTGFSAKLNAIHRAASDMTLFWRASGYTSGVV